VFPAANLRPSGDHATLQIGFESVGRVATSSRASTFQIRTWPLASLEFNRTQCERWRGCRLGCGAAAEERHRESDTKCASTSFHQGPYKPTLRPGCYYVSRSRSAPREVLKPLTNRSIGAWTKPRPRADDVRLTSRAPTAEAKAYAWLGAPLDRTVRGHRPACDDLTGPLIQAIPALPRCNTACRASEWS
jgi:hypothetical protein